MPFSSRGAGTSAKVCDPCTSTAKTVVPRSQLVRLGTAATTGGWIEGQIGGAGGSADPEQDRDRPALAGRGPVGLVADQAPRALLHVTGVGDVGPRQGHHPHAVAGHQRHEAGPQAAQFGIGDLAQEYGVSMALHMAGTPISTMAAPTK